MASMQSWTDLHAWLVKLQSDDELERKARRARRHKGKILTVEDLDSARRKARRRYDELKWQRGGENIENEVPGRR